MSALPPQKADILCAKRDVRFGSKADICAATSYVRFTPESDLGCVLGQKRTSGAGAPNTKEANESVLSPVIPAIALAAYRHQEMLGKGLASSLRGSCESPLRPSHSCSAVPIPLLP